MIAATVAEVEECNGWMDKKTLQRHRGFLICDEDFPCHGTVLERFSPYHGWLAEEPRQRRMEVLQ
jgi:hypothetical protein